VVVNEATTPAGYAENTIEKGEVSISFLKKTFVDMNFKNMLRMLCSCALRIDGA